mgnify:CR=1 FL=1
MNAKQVVGVWRGWDDNGKLLTANVEKDDLFGGYFVSYFAAGDKSALGFKHKSAKSVHGAILSKLGKNAYKVS